MVRYFSLCFMCLVIILTGVLVVRRVGAKNIGNVASYKTESPANVSVSNTGVPSTTPLSKYLIQTPQDVTMAFLKAYNACLKNPPPEAEAAASSYCQKNTGYTTVHFAENIASVSAQQKKIDPINCSLSSPKITQLNRILHRGTDATVYVLESFDFGDIHIPIDLILVNGTWKVDSVICPVPS